MQNILLVFLTGVIWCSIFSLILHFLRKKRCDISGIFCGVSAGLYAVFFLRLLFPFDLDLGVPVKVPFLLNVPYEIIRLDQYTVFGFTFPLVVPLAGLLLLIGLIKCFFLWRKYRRLNAFTILGEEVTGDRIYRFLQLQDSLRIKGKIQLLESELFPVPFSAGLLKKKICLPTMDFTDEEYKNILLHELNHFKRHDLLFIFMARLATCIFWWFPCSYMVLKDLEDFLEIRCDLYATQGMERLQRAEYLNTILKIVENQESSWLHKKFTAMSLTGKGSAGLLEERFRTVSQNEKRQAVKKWSFFSATVSIFFLFILTYSFIFFPSYDPPREKDSIEVTPENAYIICEGDGSGYMVYQNQRFHLDEELVEMSEQSGFEIRYE